MPLKSMEIGAGPRAAAAGAAATAGSAPSPLAVSSVPLLLGGSAGFGPSSPSPRGSGTNGDGTSRPRVTRHGTIAFGNPASRYTVSNTGSKVRADRKYRCFPSGSHEAPKSEKVPSVTG